MARRIKEPAEAHRARIAAAAEGLFATQGIAATSVDEIARAAGYGKATLYVYFRNKEDIVGEVALAGMNGLLACVRDALAGSPSASESCARSTRQRYDALCRALVTYQRASPFLFELVQGEISVDFSRPDTLDVERRIYEAGEELNAVVGRFIEDGIAQGDLRADIALPQTVLLFWGSLAGVIALAAHKQAYLEGPLGVPCETFLDEGFALLYRSIARDSGAR